MRLAQLIIKKHFLRTYNALLMNVLIYVVNFIFKIHYLPLRANNLVHKQGKAISGSITVNVDIDSSIKIKSNLVHHDLTRGTFFIDFMKVNE